MTVSVRAQTNWTSLALLAVLCGAPALAADKCTITSRLVHEEHPTLMTETAIETPVHNQCNLGTCWLHASLEESEGLMAYYGHTPERLSVDYMYTNIARQWFHDYVMDVKTTTPGLDTGAEERNYDGLVKQNGLVPAAAYPQIHIQHWETMNRQLAKQGDAFADQYKTAGSAADKAKVLADAQAWFEDYIGKNTNPPPKTFVYEGKTYTPQQFADALGLTGGTVTEYVDKQANADAYTVAEQTFNKVSRATLIDLIRTNVKKGLKVRAGLNWTERLDANPTTPGVLDYVQGTHTRSQAGHEINLVGYKENANGDVVGIMIQNSWGVKAGRKGYYYVDMPTFWRIFRSLSVRTNIPDGTNNLPRIGLWESVVHISG